MHGVAAIVKKRPADPRQPDLVSYNTPLLSILPKSDRLLVCVSFLKLLLLIGVPNVCHCSGTVTMACNCIVQVLLPCCIALASTGVMT